MAIETAIGLLIALTVLGFVMFALGMRFWYNAKNSRQTVISGVVAYLEEVVRVTARDEGSVFGIAIDPNEQTETKYFFHLPVGYLYANGADHYYSYLFPEVLARQLLATTEA